MGGKEGGGFRSGRRRMFRVPKKDREFDNYPQNRVQFILLNCNKFCGDRYLKGMVLDSLYNYSGEGPLCHVKRP